MNLPSLPTDNLYKFLALSGFVLGILSFGLLIHRLETNNSNGAEIRVGIEALDHYTEKNNLSLNAQIERLESISATIEMAVETPDNLVAEMPELRKEFQERTDSLRALMDEVHSDHIGRSMTLRRKSELADAYHQTTSLVFYPLLIGGVAGFAISLLGFVLWFFRLQRFQDSIVKAEAEIAKKNLEG